MEDDKGKSNWIVRKGWQRNVSWHLYVKKEGARARWGSIAFLAEGTKDALLIAGWLLDSYSECHFRSKLSSVGRASIDAQNSSHVGMTGKSFHPHILTSGPFPLEAVLLCHGWLYAYTCVWMWNFMYSREWQRRHFLLVSSAASSLLPG